MDHHAAYAVILRYKPQKQESSKVRGFFEYSIEIVLSRLLILEDIIKYLLVKNGGIV